MIDYGIISHSIEYYAAAGFLRIEAPWTVSKETSAITRPEERIDYMLDHNGKVLVASGEQSFLYMMIKGYLPPGKYQTVTPCFRYESFDMLHSKNFIKNELIITDDVSFGKFQWVAFKCLDFFEQYFPREALDTKPNPDAKNSMDIECKIDGKCYELGSYGMRTHGYLEWIYATGCAEPRLSNLRDMYKKWDTTREK